MNLSNLKMLIMQEMQNAKNSQAKSLNKNVYWKMWVSNFISINRIFEEFIISKSMDRKIYKRLIKKEK